MKQLTDNSKTGVTYSLRAIFLMLILLSFFCLEKNLELKVTLDRSEFIKLTDYTCFYQIGY